ncbi:hypothetical protein [Curtobacterium sp. MCBD17_040]|uniref:hypothetical protein n=1 Tax=Curtobacterium sp. MCBD17_040 TaxID=2175674 RepID=UPI0015E8CB26|nr:hypothetical protein [Curtobacterium sp. MCBD17_040]WIB64109.1 hypothetical protein DEI94_02625 [Curtobacterium sp. MCBD17_040]
MSMETGDRAGSPDGPHGLDGPDGPRASHGRGSPHGLAAPPGFGDPRDRSADDPAEHDRVHRRLLRRETHVSRSVAVSVTMVCVVLVAAAVALAAVLVLLHERLAGFEPRTVVDAAVAAPAGTVLPVLDVVGGLVAFLGLVLVLLGVLPKRRARHTMPSQRLAVVVDDEVLASATARAARSVTRLGPEGAVGTVGRRTAEVVLRPAAGVDVPVVAVTEAVRAEVATIDPTPAISVRVRVQPAGRVDG